MGIFGGGGGGGGDNGATQAITQGTEQGLAALKQYYAEAKPALTQGYQQAQNYLAPYSVAGGNALDAYYDMLGIARPTAGTTALTSALQNYGQGSPGQNPQTTTTTTPGTAASSTMSPALQAIIKAEGGMPLGMIRKTGGGGGSATDQFSYLDYDPAYVQYMRDNPSEAPSAATPATTQTTTVPLTAEQQAQKDLAQQYQSGSLQMSTASPESILTKLQSTPGYQFLMNQGLSAVDRSKSAQGLLGSGSAIKGTLDYSTGLANQTYQQQVQNLQQAAGLGANVAQQQGNYAAGLGTGLANAALGMGSNTASLYGGQSSGLAQVAAGQQAANAQNTSSGLGLAGTIAGGLFSMFSDAKLKRNIVPIDVLPNGLPVYEYNYIWDEKDTPVRVGLIAQDVLQVHPDAVSIDESGFYKVDYSKAVK